MAEDTGPPTAPRPSPMIPLRRFLATLQGTEEEVYGILLQYESKGIAQTAEAWRALLEDIKGRPAYRQ